MTKKTERENGQESFSDAFTAAFTSGMKQAATAHRHELEKSPKYDADVMASGQGGFEQPEDDGILP